MIAQYVRGVQSFWALLALELDSFALVKTLVAILLDGGKVYKNILAGRTLNEPITLGPIEPLHYTVLPHSYSLIPC